MPKSLKAALGPVAVGLGSFLLVVGTRVLDPRNIGWLASGDAATHYLGWAFFRAAPWGLPPGANPAYGLELSSGILYSDSIPLLALLLKPLAPALPQPFQYFGLWLLACFVLQAWFGWRLAALATKDPLLRLGISTLLVFSPPMLFRLAGHWALVGHWTLLAAVMLSLSPPRRPTGAWGTLVAVTALVHLYFLAMVLALWLASLASRGFRLPRRWLALGAELVAVFLAAGAALWAAGFFLVGAGKTGDGFGLYRMNLTAPVNAAGWSYVLPHLGWKALEDEGFNYLGLGGLALVLAAIPAALVFRRRGCLAWRRHWWPFVAVLALLTLFALSNRVGVGRAEFRYPIPASFVPLANTARASGRMFWPVFYFILAGAAVAVVKAWRPRHARLWLAVVVAAQVVDTSPGWLPNRRNLQTRATTWKTNLINGFWYEAAGVYSKLRMIPPADRPEGWEQLAGFAATHGMATNVATLARVDFARLEASIADAERALATASFRPDTLYILRGGSARVLRCRIDPSKDLLVLVDGFWAVAPAWSQAAGGRYSGLPGLPCPSLEEGTLGFGLGGSGLPLLGSGWATPEDWGTWNAGDESALNLHVNPGDWVLELDADAFVPPGSVPLDVSVGINGTVVDTWRFGGGRTSGWRRLPLAGSGATPRRVLVTFRYSALRAPADWGHSADKRRLAMALRQAKLVREGPR